MLFSLFEEKEGSLSPVLGRISKIADPNFGFIRNFKRIRQFYDEPKFWQYSASFNSSFIKHNSKNFRSVSSGISLFSQKEAVFKCLCETIERYCNHIYKNNFSTLIGSYKEIGSKGIDPRSIISFSEKQLEDDKFEKFRLSENSKFSWTEMTSLINSKEILVPSQLIYLSYPFISSEPTVYPSISTGAAGGSCLSAAIVRGIYEIIERDAFLIFYLNKLKASRIELEAVSDKRIRAAVRLQERYNLEIVSLDITTDINVPTFASIAIDRAGIGKAVSVGLKSSLDAINALSGSINEALHTRTWIRQEHEKHSKEIKPSDLLVNTEMETRGLLWYPKKRIENLDFWINTSKRKIALKDSKLSSGQQLQRLNSIFEKLDYDVLFKDITLEPFRNLEYFIVKVIVPQMQPLYLDENYKLLGGKRLYEVPEKLGYANKKEEELNSFPHPFL